METIDLNKNILKILKPNDCSLIVKNNNENTELWKVL